MQAIRNLNQEIVAAILEDHLGKDFTYMECPHLCKELTKEMQEAAQCESDYERKRIIRLLEPYAEKLGDDWNEIVFKIETGYCQLD